MVKRLLLWEVKVLLPVRIVLRVSILVDKPNVNHVLQANHQMVLDRRHVFIVLMDTRIPEQETLIVKPVPPEKLELHILVTQP